ncbi:MAG: ABC transporter permease [Advenella sp.]
MDKRSSFSIMKAVVFALLLREMRGRFGAKRFGVFWVFFEPTAQIVMMMTIFSLRGRTAGYGIEFPIFLLTGMVPFFMMRNIIFKVMESVSANKALFSYKQIKPFDTMLARTIVEVTIYACVYVILLFVLGFWFDNQVAHYHPLAWLVTIVVGVVLSFSLGMIFCMITEVLPDLKPIVRMAFFPIYLLSGVLFPVRALPPEVLNWLLWNPYLHIIDDLRSSVFEYYPPLHGVSITYPLICATILSLVAFGLYRVRKLKLVSL